MEQVRLPAFERGGTGRQLHACKQSKHSNLEHDVNTWVSPVPSRSLTIHYLLFQLSPSLPCKRPVYTDYISNCQNELLPCPASSFPALHRLDFNPTTHHLQSSLRRPKRSSPRECPSSSRSPKSNTPQSTHDKYYLHDRE